ncbi:MAG TPA: hypothetical protein VF669_01670 [Tepidisphaeraceae bacterium]|jgi:hypothetical protein
MQSEETEKVLEEARPAFRKLMMRNLLFKSSAVDPRTAAALQVHGLLRKSNPTPMKQAVLAALMDASHPMRENVATGPLVFLREDASSRTILDVRDLLVYPQQAVRAAALTYLGELAEQKNRHATPRTQQIYRKNMDAILSEEEARWRPAALQLLDAMQRDWLFTTDAVQQCAAVHCEESHLREFLSEALWPGTETFNSIELKCAAPNQSREELSKAIDRMVEEAESLRDLIEKYFDCFGTVPLASPYSLGDAVREGIEQRKWGDVWQVVWQWQKDVKSPLAEYHACQVFTLLEDHIPAESGASYWQHIFSVIDGGLIDPQKQLTSWRLRCELGRHFCQWIELQLPGHKGERLASVAWWLGERLAAALEGNPALLEKLLTEKGVADGVAGQMWELAHPAIEPSSLRYGTLFTRSIWSVSILKQLSPLLRSTALVPDPESLERLGEVMLAHVLAPIWSNQSDQSVLYAFEGSLRATYDAWVASGAPALKAEGLGDVLAHMERLQQPDELMVALRKIVEQEAASATVTSLAFRAAAFAGCVSLPDLWTQLQDEQWRSGVLGKLAMPCLQAFHEALAETIVRGDQKWIDALPHYYATAAAEAESDERREIFFVFTLAASIATQGTAAVKRLMATGFRDRFRQLTLDWREHLQNLQVQASPWLACTLRAAIAALDV